jgi:ADP-heptose:LPS heptosyltransferase
LIDRLNKEYQATLILLYASDQTDEEIAMGIYHRVQSRASCFLFSQSISRFIALIARLDLLIALDSAASHIAAAVRTPFLTLFGPQNPELTRPYHFKGRVVIKAGFSCRPCGVKCIYGDDNWCMKTIEVEDVLKSVDNLIRYRKEMETRRSQK